MSNQHRESEAFWAGFIFAFISLMLAFMLLLNIRHFTLDELHQLNKKCTNSNSKLKKLYLDGDIKCENGDMF